MESQICPAQGDYLIIPKTAVFISSDQFRGCEDIVKTIKFTCPLLEMIDECAFQEFSLIEVLNLTKAPKLHVIKNSAFKMCVSLRTVVFPCSIQEILSAAFLKCTCLCNVTFMEPSRLNTIGSAAFFENSLESFVIPERVTEIHPSAFSFNLNLVISSNSQFYIVDDGVLYSSDYSKIIQYPIYLTNTSFVLPSSTDELFPHSFSFTKVQTVTLHKKIKYIYEESFAYSNIITLVFPDCQQLDYISDRAFMYCEFLSMVDLRPLSFLRALSVSLFYSCSRIISVYLPKNIQAIHASCFQNCIALKEVVNYVESQIETIGPYAFANTNLSYFSMPPKLSNLGNLCFANSTLKYFRIHLDNPYYSFDNGTLYCQNKNYIVYYCSSLSFWSYTVAKEVTQLRYGCFYGAKNLREIIFHEKITSIMNDALAYTGLASLNLSASISHLGERCFASNANLKFVFFSTGVKIIPMQCFEGCVELIIVNIPYIEYIRQNSFKDCNKMECINAPSSIYKQILQIFPSRIISSKKCPVTKNSIIIV